MYKGIVSTGGAGTNSLWEGANMQQQRISVALRATRPDFPSGAVLARSGAKSNRPERDFVQLFKLTAT